VALTNGCPELCRLDVTRSAVSDLSVALLLNRCRRLQALCLNECSRISINAFALLPKLFNDPDESRRSQLSELSVMSTACHLATLRLLRKQCRPRDFTIEFDDYVDAGSPPEEE
jgi:hypothetical protein